MATVLCHQLTGTIRLQLERQNTVGAAGQVCMLSPCEINSVAIKQINSVAIKIYEVRENPGPSARGWRCSFLTGLFKDNENVQTKENSWYFTVMPNRDGA